MAIDPSSIIRQELSWAPTFNQRYDTPVNIDGCLELYEARGLLPHDVPGNGHCSVYALVASVIPGIREISNERVKKLRRKIASYVMGQLETDPGLLTLLDVAHNDDAIGWTAEEYCAEVGEGAEYLTDFEFQYVAETCFHVHVRFHKIESDPERTLGLILDTSPYDGDLPIVEILNITRRDDIRHYMALKPTPLVSDNEHISQWNQAHQQQQLIDFELKLQALDAEVVPPVFGVGAAGGRRTAVDFCKSIPQMQTARRNATDSAGVVEDGNAHRGALPPPIGLPAAVAGVAAQRASDFSLLENNCADYRALLPQDFICRLGPLPYLGAEINEVVVGARESALMHANGLGTTIRAMSQRVVSVLTVAGDATIAAMSITAVVNPDGRVRHNVPRAICFHVVRQGADVDSNPSPVRERLLNWSFYKQMFQNHSVGFKLGLCYVVYYGCALLEKALGLSSTTNGSDLQFVLMDAVRDVVFGYNNGHENRSAADTDAEAMLEVLGGLVLTSEDRVLVSCHEFLSVFVAPHQSIVSSVSARIAALFGENAQIGAAAVNLLFFPSSTPDYSGAARAVLAVLLEEHGCVNAAPFPSTAGSSSEVTGVHDTEMAELDDDTGPPAEFDDGGAKPRPAAVQGCNDAFNHELQTYPFEAASTRAGSLRRDPVYSGRSTEITSARTTFVHALIKAAIATNAAAAAATGAAADRVAADRKTVPKKRKRAEIEPLDASDTSAAAKQRVSLDFH
jgi:hypothetical protein